MMPAMFPDFLSIPLVIIAGLAILFFVVLLTVARNEWHLVMPYVPSREGDDQSETGYSLQANRAAEQMGFLYLGPFRHGRGGIYRIRYWIWSSPESDLLAIVSGGSMAGYPYDGTRLVSGLEDGRFVLTIDNPSMGQLHGDGLADGSTFMGVDFPSLVEHHHGLVGGDSIPFDDSDPVGHFVEWRAELADRLVDAGFAHYLDEEKTAWRYTIRGAFRRVLRSLRIQFRVLSLNKLGLPTGRSVRPPRHHSEG